MIRRAWAMRRGPGPLRALLVLAMLAGVAACDSGGSGPGTLRGSVELVGGGSPGSALLVIQGAGVLAVEGTGGTRSWTAPDPGGAAALRVLLMDPDPDGGMTFDVEVDELDAPLPGVSVYQVADRDNARLPSTTELRVTFGR